MLTQERANMLVGGVFLIGMAALFYTNYWWPGIMFVIGAAAILRGLLQGQGWYAFHGGFWIIAVGVWALFRFNPWIVLATVGVNMILLALFRPPIFAPKPHVDNSLE